MKMTQVFSSILIVLIIAFLVGGIFWHIHQKKLGETTAIATSTPQTTSRESINDDTKNSSAKLEFKRYTNESIGFSVDVPIGWTFAEVRENSVSFTSPDFKVAESHEFGIEDTLESGARVYFNREPNILSESIQDPESYISFLEAIKNCSNCISSERVQINGVPALLRFYRAASVQTRSQSGFAGVRFPKGSDEFGFIYEYASELPSETDKQILQKMIQSYSAIQ